MHKKIIKGEYLTTEIIKLAISGGVIILTLTCSINKILKEQNKTKKANQVVNLAKVIQKIPEHVCAAEELIGPGNGEKKLLIVLEKIKLDCLKLQVDYEAQEEDLKVEIEKILDAPQKKTNEASTNEY